MKSLILTSITVALLAAGTALKAQNRQEEYLGLPGDNLNLYAVMQLFQNSKTLEEFERELNDKNSNINNLDLNYDNLVDYIKVIDNVDGSVHNIVLQVAVGPRENQDVAVFTVVRFNNGQVQIQLTGDEALYGKYYIIEPITEETPNPGYNGTYVTTTPAQIAYWPVVRYIYLPTYTVWRSRWYWGYYPSYWDPWHTYSWHYYNGYHYNWNQYYYSHYHHYDKHRHTGWNDYYYHGRRSYSPQVSQRISTGVYKTTYSRPEERRKGEQLFAKKHPEEYRRSSEVNNFKNSRRSVNTNNATNSRSDNSVRRSDNDRSDNSRSINSVNKSNNTETRSSDKVTNGSSRRSSESVSNKPATEKSNSQPNNIKTNRRSESGEVKKSGQQSTQSVNRQAAPSRQKSSGSEVRKSEPSQKSQPSSGRTKSESTKSSSKKDTETKPERRRQ